MSGFPQVDSTLMLFLAVMLDLLGLICLLLDFLEIGFGISFLPDLLGWVFIGGWLYIIRGDGINLKGKTLKKLLGFGGGEIIPVLGDIAPFWTLLAIKEILSE